MKAIREWRRLHNKELNHLYSSQHYSRDQLKKNEMDGACNMYGGQERRIQGFGGETRGQEITRKTCT